MTRATRDLSATTNTPQGYRSTSQYGGQSDNFDANSPSRLGFFIDEESVILSAKLKVEISKYRTWEDDVASGGGSTPTTASGGGSTPTTSTDESGTGINSAPHAHTETGGTTSDNLTSHFHAISHDHSVTIASHQHSVTISSHQHAQQYAVVEVGGAPGALSVALDGVDVTSAVGGPWEVSALPSTFEADLGGLLHVPGWHSLEISTATGVARATPYIIVKSLALS